MAAPANPRLPGPRWVPIVQRPAEKHVQPALGWSTLLRTRSRTRQNPSAVTARRIADCLPWQAAPFDPAQEIVLDDFHRQLMLHESGELAHQHRESAVAGDTDDLSTGVGDGGAYAVWKSARHGGEGARGRTLHLVSHVNMLRGPRDDGARITTDDHIGPEQRIEVVCHWSIMILGLKSLVSDGRTQSQVTDEAISHRGEECIVGGTALTQKAQSLNTI